MVTTLAGEGFKEEEGQVLLRFLILCSKWTEGKAAESMEGEERREGVFSLRKATLRVGCLL